MASANYKPAGGSAEYSPDERRLLLEVAHRGIKAALASEEIDTTAPSEHLAQPRGAFTTLHLHGKLRGCVGYVVPMYPVYRTVAETAVAAAFYDSRFYPVSAREAAELKVELSILSPLSPITAEEVEVGIHGLVISTDRHRGLLLPQVPVEHGWDRVTFLQQTCYKAGLPPDAWLQGATLEAFSAEVFGETGE